MSKMVIYHNPRCSKSRETLKLIQQQGIEPEVVLYLETPPDQQQLRKIIKALGITPRELLRNTEKDYKEQGLKDTSFSDEELIDAMVTTPKLMQRPIVMRGNQAVIGRPPESVLELCH